MKILLTLIIAFFFSFHFSFSQENELKGLEQEGKNRIGFVVGVTFVPEGTTSETCEECDEDSNGFVVPSFGLEYTRTLSYHWDISFSAEIELDKYIINNIDLNRHNPLILSISMIYRLVDSWFVFGGVGVEFEKHKHLGVFRFGTDYEFVLGNGWDVTPAFTFDHKIDLNSYGLGVSIGRKF